MTDNGMAKRKKCNQKQYMVLQIMQWLREKSVIRNSIWYDRQGNGYEKKEKRKNMIYKTLHRKLKMKNTKLTFGGELK